MRWQEDWDEQYRPRGRRIRSPKPARKRPKNAKRMSWPRVRIPPDIDLMKPETLGGGFCSCGQRRIDDALCLRCISLDWFDQS